MYTQAKVAVRPDEDRVAGNMAVLKLPTMENGEAS